jgi:hypothetical protein
MLLSRVTHRLCVGHLDARAAETFSTNVGTCNFGNLYYKSALPDKRLLCRCDKTKGYMSSGGTCTQSEAFSPTHFPTWAAVMIPVIAIATIVILWRCFKCMRRRPKQAHIESLGLLQPSSRVANTGDVGMSRQTVPDAAVHSTIELGDIHTTEEADNSHVKSSNVIDARPAVAIEMESTAAGRSNT